MWVKAHLTQRAAEIRGIDRHVWRGNALADRLATTASHAARIDPEVRKLRTARRTNACLVAQIAAAVWKHYVSVARERLRKQRYYSRLGKPAVTVEIERRPDFPEGMHYLARQGPKLWCLACEGQPGKTAVSHWVHTACTANGNAGRWQQNPDNPTVEDPQPAKIAER